MTAMLLPLYGTNMKWPFSPRQIQTEEPVCQNYLLLILIKPPWYFLCFLDRIQHTPKPAVMYHTTGSVRVKSDRIPEMCCCTDSDFVLTFFVGCLGPETRLCKIFLLNSYIFILFHLSEIFNFSCLKNTLAVKTCWGHYISTTINPRLT